MKYAEDDAVKALAEAFGRDIGRVLPNVKKLTTDALRAPLPTDDASQGYEAGSRWQHEGQEWVLANPAAGAAAWVPSTFGGHVERFGARGDGTTNDINAERAAQAWATGLARPKAIEYENKRYIGVENVRSIYGSGFIQTGLWKRAQAGTTQYPTPAAEPVLMIGKTSNTDAPNGGWDSGAIYGFLNRVGGNAFGGAAVTGVATFSAGAGDLVGVHGRVRVEAAGNTGGWGGWFYATDTAAGCRHLIGVEVNVVKKGPDAGWQSTPTVPNTSRGVAVITEHDNTAPGTMGVYIGGRGASNPMSKWYTGLMVLQDGIMPNPGDAATELGNGEALRLQGGSSYSNRYGGLRFEKGQFQYGVSFAEATFAGNAALILGANQRIVFGNRPGAAQRISYDGTSLLNINEMDLGRDGVRLLTSRRTGWTASTGTATRSAYDTASVTTAQLAERVKALLDDLISHGLIGA